ncbi:MAG TPA: MXAN_6577-like cysteine-rich protein [Anaeromyxobacter sp.]|nr:MXAN_6577-like cysteine-rich protein [Anaeromyxobacter sp.]
MRTLRPAVAILATTLAACGKSVECPAGETECGGSCVSLATDLDNCGSCGVAATSLQICRAGGLACAPDVGVCGGTCTDLSRDPDHCGDCATACGAGELCLTDSGGTRCTSSCPLGYDACGGACVETTTDRLNCGACGHACNGTQTCRAGVCAAPLEVACYASDDVRPVTLDLLPAGAARLAQGGPTALAVGVSYFYSGNGYPGGVTVFPIDDRQAAHVVPLSGSDVEGLAAVNGALLVANAASNSLAILAADGTVLDEVSLGGQGTAPNPHGTALAGSTAFVALYGDGPNGFSGYAQTTGQKIALVDLTGLPGCIAGTNSDCATVAGAIDLMAVSGSSDLDQGGYPFPSRVAVHGTQVYVTLANLKRADCGGGLFGYCEPAGDGKLAVIDTTRLSTPPLEDAVSILDLGQGCKNPGDIEMDGDRAWVVCGSFTFRSEAPGTVVSIDLSGPAPVLGIQVDASAVVPGGLAICGGMGYVTDQASGMVLRFDPGSGLADAPVTVCPSVKSFAWAADLACLRP